MTRRSLYIIGILLFLLLGASCQRLNDTSVNNENSIDWIKDDDKQNYMDSKLLVENEDITTSVNNIDEDISLGNLDEEDVTVEDNHMILVKDILNTYSGDKLVVMMKAFPAGTSINIKGVEDKELRSLFYYHDISEEVKDRINGKSYGEDCTVPYDELRYIRVLHRGFDGNTYIGELIMNQALAEDVIEIFKELYELHYPIERMVLVDEYDANDDLSMAANNSSAFNFRIIAGTKRLSLHSQGLAIDINPLYNPYITSIDGRETVLPSEAMEYTDRNLDNPYYIRKGDPCYEAFVSRGFTWGGEWKNSKDYQHFQKVLEE